MSGGRGGDTNTQAQHPLFSIVKRTKVGTAGDCEHRAARKQIKALPGLDGLRDRTLFPSLAVGPLE